LKNLKKKEKLENQRRRKKARRLKNKMELQEAQELRQGEKLTVGSVGDRALTRNGVEIFLRKDVLTFTTLCRDPLAKQPKEIFQLERKHEILQMDLPNGLWKGVLGNPRDFAVQRVFVEGSEDYERYDNFLKYYGADE
jgi:hypothetical protein